LATDQNSYYYEPAGVDPVAVEDIQNCSQLKIKISEFSLPTNVQKPTIDKTYLMFEGGILKLVFRKN
jgi:ABC-type lipopolysaccharide export system ATPase subunit